MTDLLDVNSLRQLAGAITPRTAQCRQTLVMRWTIDKDTQRPVGRWLLEAKARIDLDADLNA